MRVKVPFRILSRRYQMKLEIRLVLVKHHIPLPRIVSYHSTNPLLVRRDEKEPTRGIIVRYIQPHPFGGFSGRNNPRSNRLDARYVLALLPSAFLLDSKSP